MSNIIVDSEQSTTETQVEQEVLQTEGQETQEQYSAGEAEENTAVEETVSIEDSSNIPEKFVGKSVEDIIDSYTNLEKELGRKSQEVGELRKLSDSFLQAEVSRNSSANNLQAEDSNKNETQEEVDFYDDPSKAVNSLIENHPKFREFQQFQAQQQQGVSKEQLEQAHPDYVDIVQDSKFQDWVQESSFRTNLFKEADGYNFEAADELLTHWKERSMIDKTKEVKEQQEAQRKENLKAGKTESRTSTESVASGKEFRRADLIRLKQTDPNRYYDLADEIYQAYQEGRVR